MKLSFSIFLISILLSAQSMADVSGSATMIATPLGEKPYTYFDVTQSGGAISGHGECIYDLKPWQGGYQGVSCDAKLSLTCKNQKCENQANPEIHLQITSQSNGYQIHGTVNRIEVQAVLTKNKITLNAVSPSSNVKLNLDRQANGNLDGIGELTFSVPFASTTKFNLSLKTTGSLENFSNPVDFIVVILNSFVKLI